MSPAPADWVGNSRSEEVSITSANVNDGKAVPDALPEIPGEVFADSAYRGNHFAADRINEKMVGLERRKKELETFLSTATEPPPLLHPEMRPSTAPASANCTWRYRLMGKGSGWRRRRRYARSSTPWC